MGGRRALSWHKQVELRLRSATQGNASTSSALVRLLLAEILRIADRECFAQAGPLIDNRQAGLQAQRPDRECVVRQAQGST